MQRFFLIAVLLAGIQHSALAAGPARWLLADDDTKIILMGSVHVLKPGTSWIDDDIRSLVGSSDRLYLEMAPDQQSPQVIQPLIRQHALLPPGETLQDIVPADLYTATLAAFREVGVPATAIQQFRPWFAGVNYTVLKFQQLGYSPQAGVEARLTSLAIGEGKPILGLETAAEQMGFFGSLSRQAEIDFLRSGLDERGEFEQVMTRLTQGWVSGDIADLEAYFTQSFAAFPALREKLLYARNRNWIDDITALLDQDGQFLIVVGTAHLVGTQSVPDLLRGAGYSVSRVN